MRVAGKTIYDAIRFNLGNITEELYKANKVVSTGKRITGLSDDPPLKVLWPECRILSPMPRSCVLRWPRPPQRLHKEPPQ